MSRAGDALNYEIAVSLALGRPVQRETLLSEQEATIAALPATVKRADLFGNVTDTYATEGELNGWREAQAKLVGRQGGLL